MNKKIMGIIMCTFVFALLVSARTSVFAVETVDEQVQYDEAVSDEMETDENIFAKTSKYTIKFNGNKATSGKMSAMKSCKYGKSYKLPANTFKRKGYTFTGWNTKADGLGKSYKNKATVKNLTSKNGKTVTLYAQWKKTKYTITYKLNGGKNNKNNPSKYYVTSKTIKLKNATRTGYTFKGWYSDSKYKKKVTSIKKGSTGDKTFYAKWSENKYNIAFHANGGTGKMSSLKNRKYASSYVLPLNTFERKGYEFTGWNTKADGSGKTYKDKATIKKLTSKNGKTVTLYAQWKKTAVEAVDITLTVWCPENQYKSGLILEQQKEFAAAHPEWNIIWKTVTIGEDYVKSELLKASPEHAPDVFFFVNDQIPELVEAGYLTKFEGNTKKMITENFAESVVDSVKQNGDIYAIPASHMTFFMYYDKGHLTAKDIKSLDTIVKKDTKDGVYNFWFDSSGGWKTAAWYYGAGLTVFGKYGDDLSAGCGWNSKKGVAVTKYLIEMCNNEKVRMAYDTYEIYDLLKERKIGAWFDGSWSYGEYKRILGDALGVAVIPTYGLNGEQVQLKSFYGSKAIGVNTKSKNQEAAIAFAEFLGSDEQQIARYEKTGQVPANINALESEAVQKDPVAKVLIEESNNCSVTQPVSVLFASRFWNFAGCITTDIRSGNLTDENAQEYMDTLVAAMCKQ